MGIQRILVPLIKVRFLTPQPILWIMKRREAVNLICKYYEFDAAKIAAAMQAEIAEDNAALVAILEDMISELRKMADALTPTAPIRIISKPEPVVAVKVKKPRGRQPNPDRKAQAIKDYIAKRRSQLRNNGYFIAKNSMIAYYDDQTRRRKKTEESNKFGFIFRPKEKK